MGKAKVKVQVQSLAEYAATHRIARGTSCDTCGRPFQAELDEAGKKGARPVVVIAWLQMKGFEFSRSSVERHLRERHWERAAKPIARVSA